MAKVFPMSSFKPTLHNKGYKQQRPMSRSMIKVLPKDHRRSYRRGFRKRKPVPKTPPRIGGPPKERRTKKKAQRDEGETEEREMSEHRVLEVDSSPPQKHQKKKQAKKAKVAPTEAPQVRAEEPHVHPTPRPKKRLRKTFAEAEVDETPVAKKAKKSKGKQIASLAHATEALVTEDVLTVHDVEEPSTEVPLKRKKRSKKSTEEPSTQKSPSPLEDIPKELFIETNLDAWTFNDPNIDVGTEVIISEDEAQLEVEGRDKDDESVRISVEAEVCGEKDAMCTPPIQTPSATHMTGPHVLGEKTIETSVHTLNQTPTNLEEDTLSSSVERTRRDPSLTSSSSQKEGDFNIRIHSHKDSTPHKEASVVSPHESEHPKPASEADENHRD